MLTCYHCGKILFGKKVLGQVGSSIYYFCSEKCRSAVWNKAGVKNPEDAAVLPKKLKPAQTIAVLTALKFVNLVLHQNYQFRVQNTVTAQKLTALQ